MVKLTQDEESYMGCRKDKFHIPICREKIEDLKKSVENILNDEISPSDLHNIRDSLRELELHSSNNADIENCGKDEMLRNDYNEKTFEQMRNELIKQKNLNSCLSLKLRSIHIKLNSLCLKKNELEKTIQNRIREIELQFLDFGKVSKDVDTACSQKEENVLVDLPDNIAEYEMENNVDIEKLKKMVSEYEKSIEMYKVGKIKIDFELDCYKKKLSEEVERNNEYIDKLRTCEMNMSIIKNENFKNVEELKELKMEIEKWKNMNSRVDMKYKLLIEEKNNLTEINNDLKLKLKSVNDFLSRSKNKEYILTNFTEKIYSIIVYLKKNDDCLIENDKVGNMLDLDNEQIFVQAEMYIDVISASIKSLINIKRSFQERTNELEKVQREFLQKCRSYEEMKLEMGRLEGVEKNNVKMYSEKENNERMIYKLKEKLEKDERQIAELKKRNSYHVYLIKNFKKTEYNMISEINKLKMFIEENKMNVEKDNETYCKKIKIMKEKNSELVNSLNNISCELKKCVNQMNCVGKNMKSLKNEKEKVKKELQLLKIKNETLKGEFKRAENVKKTIKLKLYTLNNDITHMNAKLNKSREIHKKTVKHLSYCKKKCQEELKRRTNKIVLLKNNYYHLKGEIQKWKKKIKQNEDIIKTVQSKFKESTENNEKLNAEIKKQNWYIKNKEKKIKYLTIVKNNLLRKDKINKLKLFQINSIMKNCKSKIKKIKHENRKLNNIIHKLKNELDKEELKNVYINKEIDIFKKKKKNTFLNLEKNIIEKENVISNMKQEIVNIKKNLDEKLNTSTTFEIKKLNERINELNQTIISYEKKNLQLNIDIKNVTKKLKKEQISKNKEKKKYTNISSIMKKNQIKLKKQENEILSLKEEKRKIEENRIGDIFQIEVKLKNQFEKEKTTLIQERHEAIQEEKKTYQTKEKLLTDQHKEEIAKMKEDMHKEIERVKNTCDMHLKSQLIQNENEKKIQIKKINEYDLLLKQKDQEIKKIIHDYDERMQTLNRDMENLIYECEDKLHKAKLSKQIATEGDINANISVTHGTGSNNTFGTIPVHTSPHDVLIVQEKDKKINELQKELDTNKEEIIELVEKNHMLKNANLKASNYVTTLAQENRKLKEELQKSILTVHTEDALTVHARGGTDAVETVGKHDVARTSEKKEEEDIDHGEDDDDYADERDKREKTRTRTRTKTRARTKNKNKKHGDSDGNEEGEEEEGARTNLPSSPLEEPLNTKQNCYTYLKWLNGQMDEIIGKLKAKDEALLNDAFNKINFAISAWNLFNEEKPTEEEPAEEKPPQDRSSEAGEVIGEEGVFAQEPFNEELYEVLKKEISEKVELIQQLTG